MKSMLSAIVLIGLFLLAEAFRPARNYTDNDYYVLHLGPAVEPRQMALQLDMEHEGQLGELRDHHVFRAPKATHDVIDEMKRRRKMKNKVKRHVHASANRNKEEEGGEGESDEDDDILDGILFAQKQQVRNRIESRVTLPSSSTASSVDGLTKRGDKPFSKWWKNPLYGGEWWLLGKDDTAERKQKIIDELNITDPLFPEQWHLHNKEYHVHSINVGHVWKYVGSGKGVTVAIVDDGIDTSAKDLKDNFNSEGSWNFYDHKADPTPQNPMKCPHGTRSAGVVAAARNGICGVGVAHSSNVSGIRMLGGGGLAEADEAEAMSYRPQVNDIYSCSWGPTDNGEKMFGPPLLVKRAMHQNILTGRGGLGSVYVFATGNGGEKGDNCNFDGYTNSIYSITVGSVMRNGHHPPYAEKCAANLVSTYSSGEVKGKQHYIHTVDVGEDRCWNKFGGTSASAPLAAGVFALALEKRPDLTWRDLQHIAVESASNEGLHDAERQGMHKFSHKFGFGKVDAQLLVELARKWKNVAPQSWWYGPVMAIDEDIPQGARGLKKTINVKPMELHQANFHDRLEHVTVTLTVDHTRRGDLSVDLISPSGTVSHLATLRSRDNATVGFDNWTFMSVACWGERASGKWEVIVRDTEKNEHRGKLVQWSLELYGSVWDKYNVEPLPMPGTPRVNMNHTALVRSRGSGFTEGRSSVGTVGVGYRWF